MAENKRWDEWANPLGLGSEFLSLYICLFLFFLNGKASKLNKTRIQIFDILVIQLRRLNFKLCENYR